MAAPTRKKTFDIVGESHNAADGTPRQHILAEVNPSDEVTLERQPANAFDPNAVAVLWKGRDMGFLSKEDAAALAPALDEGRQYVAQVHELKGGVAGYASYGVKVSIAWDGKALPPAKPLDEQQQRARRGKLSAMGRERDATGAFAGNGPKGEPKGGCMGVLIACVLVGTAGLYRLI